MGSVGERGIDRAVGMHLFVLDKPRLLWELLNTCWPYLDVNESPTAQCGNSCNPARVMELNKHCGWYTFRHRDYINLGRVNAIPAKF